MSEIEHREIDANGVRLHVAMQGRGPAVLLCHGFPESWYSYRHQLPALAEAGLLALAPDMRGYGRSERPEASDQYTLMHLVGDMMGLLDALSIESAVIVGHDWGAPVAWHAALMRPDRFRAVVGLSIPFAHPPPHPTRLMPSDERSIYYQLLFQEPGVAEAVFEADVRRTLRSVLYSLSSDNINPPESGLMLPRNVDLFKYLGEPSALPAWLSEADLDVYVREFERTGFRGGLEWYRNIDRNSELVRPWRGARITVPAMFMVGDRDVAHSLLGVSDAIAELPRNVPGLRRTVVLPGCGHWTQQERSREVNAALIEFVRGL
jgi:pimeloyl-ACP methyl ester carboxylesterase